MLDDIHASFRKQGLVRPHEGTVFAGVCAGVGRRFGLAAWPTRALFIISLILIPGSQILVYPLLWILMPRETTSAQGPTYGTPPMA
jgi:phage shock protein C